MASRGDRATQLSGLERILLLVPIVGSAFFGLGALLIPLRFATAFGYSGHDPYVYRLVGAAIVGFAGALAWAALGKVWERARLLVIAGLAISVSSLYAVAVEVAGGHAQPVVYLVLALRLAIVAITGWVLYMHRGAPRPAQDIASWLVWFLALATLLSVPFALLPLFVPVQFGHSFGFQATDVFTYREGGATLVGYATLGVFEVLSRRWAEVRSAAIMVVMFNTLAALVSILALVNNTGKSLAPIVLVASGVIAVATLVELLRGGK
jgi:hypothetical protein